MDTRSKIVMPDQARERLREQFAGAVFVTGFFDPLLAAHARRLAGLRQEGRPLVAIVEDAPRALLPQRARAELVAGLAAVDWVVIGDGTPLEGGAAVADERDADLERREVLMRRARSGRE